MEAVQEIGSIPELGPVAREKRIFYKLSDQTAFKMITGRKTPALMSVWASNDVLQFGTIKLLTGGPGPQQTECDKHPGDAVFYVLEGTITFFLTDRKETFNAEQGDFMFIPENEAYKIINYGGKPTKAVFAVAPKF